MNTELLPNHHSGKINRLLWILAAGIFALNALQAWLTPLIDDEAYYWVWSQKPDWGYFDHPPMVAWWIKPGFLLLQNELGVRLITAAAAALGFWILGNFLRLKSRAELVLYTALYMSFVMFQIFSFITTPDAPLLFFSIVYVVVWRRFLQNASWLNSALLGVCMALLMYSKYHAALLILFSILPVFWQLRRNVQLYSAVLLGVVLYLPHLWWQWQHDFVSIEFHLVRRSVHDHFKFNFITDYLLAIVYTGSPLVFYWVVKRLLKPRWSSSFEKSMYWTVLVTLIFLLLMTFKTYVQAQWILVALVPMFYLLFQFLRNKPQWVATTQKLAIVGAGLLLLARIYMAIPSPPVKIQYHGYKEFMQQAGQHTDKWAAFERYQSTSLFNFYNYPHKQAANIVTIENRKSQYDIWQSEEMLQGNDFTYFSQFIQSQDSLMLHSARTESYKYRKIEDFQTLYLIAMQVLEAESTADSIFLTINLENHHQRAVSYTPEGTMKLYANFTPEMYALESYCMEEVQIPAFQLEPGQSVQLRAKLPRCALQDGKHFIYLGFAQEGIPMKIQSNHLQIYYPHSPQTGKSSQTN
ncbi:MAG: glycosyltransferase family 39 protein [Weeksellaceae bacterium]|nr:glycosyltransferase family 39 protein [Weeksellaceae bacterium]